MLPLEELVDVLVEELVDVLLVDVPLELLVDVVLEPVVDVPPVPATEPPVPLACIPPDPPGEPSVDDEQPIEPQRSISIAVAPTMNRARVVHRDETGRRGLVRGQVCMLGIRQGVCHGWERRRTR
ncbi:Hypothetical protein A7982_08043 [Minicystis rosea]|nr:Hypothetical protein A7982_08043 [Minicystis rosea]